MDTQPSPLEAFGYSRAQAAFLTLVARHSGYFLRRHYRAALPPEADDELGDFLPQLIDRRHVVSVRLDSQTLAYHLRARRLYRALGMPDHRNRRAHGHTAVLERLMALDVVLRYSTWRVVVGEAETLAFFVDERGVSPDLLPRTRYHHVRDPRAVTVRHVAASGPVFVPAPGQVLFTYIDVGDWTLGRFRAFVRRHLALWRRLEPGVTVLFATVDATRARQAARVFARAAGMESTPRDLAQLRADFEARHRLETRALDGLAQADLDALREGARRVTASIFDAPYRAWQCQGDAGLGRLVESAAGALLAPPIGLDVWHVPHRYGQPLYAWGRG